MLKPPIQTFGEGSAERVVMAQTIDYPDGAREPAHVHYRAQLLYATSGIVRVTTPLGLWMITPGQALLIGSQVEHALQMVGAVAMRTLYIQPAVLKTSEALEVSEVSATLKKPQGECRLIAVCDLMRASILGFFSKHRDDTETRVTHRIALIVPLLLHLLKEADHPDNSDDPEKSGSAVRLPLPADMRLRHICESLMNQPGNHETVERWADRINISARTLARMFQQETGMTFSRWREQLRLSEATSRLCVGHPLSRIAHDLGYADARTLSVMFKRTFGDTPQQFMRRITTQ